MNLTIVNIVPSAGEGDEMEKSIVPMQIRLPANLHEYAKEEAAKMGIPLNSFLVVLMTQGKKLWEAKIETTVQV